MLLGWGLVVGCGSPPLPGPARLSGRDWPAAGPGFALAGRSIRVAPAVAAIGDPRYRGSPSRYAADDEPWRWTDEQRIAAAAYDLADLVHLPVLPWSGPTDDGNVLVGRPADFDLRSPFAPLTPETREQHALRTTGAGLLALGVEGAGVELAVVDLRRALGERWYLPDPDWHVVPAVDRAPALDVRDPGPRLAARRVSGPVSGAEGRVFAAWARANGFVGGLQVKAIQGQWGPIAEVLEGWLRDNPGAVSAASRPEAHEGRTGQVKWCPDAQDAGGDSVADRIAEDWARPRLDRAPADLDNTVTRDVVSLHQGDSAFWAGCADGSTPADRAVAVANGVARRLGPRLGERRVSVMGYREVFAGPLQERLDPRLFVWLMGGGYLGVRWEDALARWKDAGARHLGWYGYWNLGRERVPTEDTPFLAVRPRAAELASLPDHGFEAVWIEQDGAFEVGGWYKWLLLDIARDPSGPDPVGRRVADLIAHAFPGAASTPMRRYLLRFDTSDQRLLLSPEWVGAAWADLREARAAADPATIRRIDDLAIGLRTVERSLDPAAPVDAELAAARRGGPVPFAAWSAGAYPPEPAFWAGDAGGWARATRFPGSARGGSYEGDWRGLPRDAELWRVWIDPRAGLTTRACAGVEDQGRQDPARVHTTSRLLGRASLVLVDPHGAPVCEASLPPDRRARAIRFGADAVELAPSEPGGTRCLDGPAERPLDTGLPEDPDALCTDLVEEGVYTLASRNHRTGLDLGRLDGVLGAARWDSPFGPAEERRPDAGATWRYFYVPLGQQVVTVYSGRSACALQRDGVRADDVELGGAPGYRRVDTLGHDGEIWLLAGCRDVWLVDVPPAVSPRWDQLLVPCAFALDPARQADVARLGVDVGDCD